jgi:L-amino acid N-acyltransferase YncA
MNYTIDKMTFDDWDAVRAIYEEGIATEMATFETTVPDWDEWNASHLKICRLVVRADGKVIGWAALNAISHRQAYVGVAEVSIYIANHVQGMGIGKKLLGKLVKESEAENLWTLQAGIFPENKASLAIHKANGFREVGYRERIGQLNGIWKDVILFERRSKIIGA